jgi:hypothetical protein
MATPLLGAYVGNSYPADEAALREVGALIGRQPDYALIFLNHDSWSAFDSSVSWALSQWPSHGKLIVSMPLIPWGANLDTAASGGYNQHYLAAAQKLAAYDPNMVVRVGWEMNGAGWWPWSAVNDPDGYIGAFRELVDTFRSVSPGFKFSWEPNMGTQGLNPERAYPGDHYVDFIGMSVYENTQWLGGKSAAERWDYIVNQPHGLAWQKDFAAAHGKQMSYGEYSSNFNDGAFVKSMAAWIKSHDVAFHSWWDVNDTFNGDLDLHPANRDAFHDAWSGGAAPTPTPSPTPPPGGSGSDTLVLHLSENAWNGHAQFAVSVDGKEIGHGQSVTASHGAGQSQDFTFKGNFGTGTHKVEVTFLNDAWGGTTATDRNLYVDGIDFNGHKVAGASAALLSTGSTGTFTVSGSATPTPTPAPAPAPAPTPAPGGSGKDTLVLRLAEDAWNGHAQFAVAVDGTEIGRGQSVTAAHGAGQAQDFTYHGDFGAGAHKVEVTFLNDAWGGTQATDRNLYVEGIVFNGTTVGAKAALLHTGADAVFTVGGTATPTPTPAPAPTPSPSGGHDRLVLHLSGDAWQGDPAFAVTVDGKALASGQKVTAAHDAGQSQDFVYEGDFGAGAHKVQVTFLNDAWGGTQATDRNLYVDGIDFNGHAVAGAAADLLRSGDAHGVTVGGAAANAFAALAAPATAPIVVGTDPGRLAGSDQPDLFVFEKAASHDTVIAGFDVGHDVLDLRGMLKDAGYAGSDPVADHVLQIAQHGADTVIALAQDGAAHTVVTLQNVAAASLHAGEDYLWA